MANTTVSKLTEFKGSDLEDLCTAAEAAIDAGGGFGWLTPPPRPVFEKYWQGILLVPDLSLFVARISGAIVGACQLYRLPKSNEAQAHSARLTGMFLAPWARGQGLARGLVGIVESTAHDEGFRVLNLDVRETQTRAIEVYEASGFVRWGTHPMYARVDGRYVAGHAYYKELQ